MLARPSPADVNPLHLRAVVLITLVCFFAACHKWVPIESPVEQALDEQSGKVRITDVDGGVAELDTTWVASDSVFGVTKSDTMALALSEIAEAEQQKPDYLANVGLVFGSLAVGFGIAVLVCIAACEFD